MIASMMIPQYMKTSIIRLDSYVHKTMQGRFSNSYFDKEQSFSSFIELLTLLDSLADKIDYPQTTTKPRSFYQERTKLRNSKKKERSYLHPPVLRTISELRQDENTKGELATFALTILSRQNADWQGKIVWINGNQEQYFRSVLELVKMIDSVLTDSSTPALTEETAI